LEAVAQLKAYIAFKMFEVWWKFLICYSVSNVRC